MITAYAGQEGSGHLISNGSALTTQSFNPCSDNGSLSASQATSHFRPPIMRLFQSRGPAAVVWRVRTIVVDALKSQAFRRLAHVLKESGEVLPSVADLDPASTIVFVVPRLWVCASLEHLRPYVPAASVPRTMASASDACELSPQASATVNHAAAQRVHTDVGDSSAVAGQLPNHTSALALIGRSKSYEPSEALTGNVMSYASLSFSS